jgi:putative colanic acid biosynthesis UDP-glucose lipid carrier transferase
MNSRFLRHLQLTLLGLDLFGINVVFIISEFLFRDKLIAERWAEYHYFGFFLSIVWLGVASSGGIYNRKSTLSFEVFARCSLQAFAYFLMVIVFCFCLQLIDLSKIFIVAILFSISVTLLVNRILYFIIYQYFKNKDYLLNKVIVIGYNPLSKKLVNYLETDAINKKVIGFCEEYENVSELSLHPILSKISDALEVCKEYGATEIYSTVSPEQNPHIYQLISKADQNCIRFKFVPDFGTFIKRQFHVEHLNEMPVISLRNEPMEDLDSRIRKRLFDIVVSSLVLLYILSWLIPLIALLIKIESKGPVFFIQPRSGKDNKNFPCLKFRSMFVNERANEKQATKNDSRITKIGKFLRRTNLDEFPQFLNVLTGHMSIVGPRPHMLKHTDEYSRLIGQYMVRQFLKPGITGWAQVNGFRGETQTILQMQKRVEHDLWYMENWSLWLDIKIMFLTVYNTFKGEENAF